MGLTRRALALAALAPALAYENGSPGRLPPMGWSSWIALGPGAAAPEFDYCDEFSVKASFRATYNTERVPPRQHTRAPPTHGSAIRRTPPPLQASIDAFVELGFPQLGWNHIHLDDVSRRLVWKSPTRFTRVCVCRGDTHTRGW